MSKVIGKLVEAQLYVEVKHEDANDELVVLGEEAETNCFELHSVDTRVFDASVSNDDIINNFAGLDYTVLDIKSFTADDLIFGEGEVVHIEK